ncbi:hypothetical protein CEP51_004874 [Fusarium floridanum]|uniref:Siderophore biosynthesis n=1 Tax=Fusarium floridanum TaxID=1325733 RepID=A0A428RZ75_9HYPO|nr:hypothetical protein CEP51_004874 [Fusarium floridanum]
MVRPTVTSAIPLLMLAKLAAGIGCNTHSFTTCDDGIVHWYDPEDGQICDPLDCGGGRAPPKKNPGCAGYTGTEVRTISYLSCWKDFATVGFTSAAEPTTEAEVETETDVETDTQPAETESSESSPSTTTEADESTATSAAATTSAATLSTRTQTSAEAETSTEEEETTTGEASASAAGTEASTAGSEASTAENEANTPTTTPNAGQILRGSIVAVFGFAVGVIALA